MLLLHNDVLQHHSRARRPLPNSFFAVGCVQSIQPTKTMDGEMLAVRVPQAICTPLPPNADAMPNDRQNAMACKALNSDYRMI